MQSTASAKPNHQFRIALLGDPGTRKTTLGLHFSLFERHRGKHLYVADLDGNMTTALGLFQDHYPDVEIFYTDFTELAAKEQKRLNKDVKQFNQATVFDLFLKDLDVATRDPRIGAIMVDSQSAINPMLIDVCAGNKDKMQLQDWGDFKNRLQNLILAIRASGKVLIWTVHQVAMMDPVLDAKGNKVGETIREYTFNIPGASKDYFGSFFSDTWYLDLVRRGTGMEWLLATAPTAQQAHVKNSLNLKPVITLPNEYAKLESIIWELIKSRYPSA